MLKCSALRTLLHAAIGAILASVDQTYASDESMRNARMNSCVKLLQKNDRALRNSWKGHCGTDELDKEVAAVDSAGPANSFAPLFAEIGSTISKGQHGCQDARTPIPMTEKCGLGSNDLFQNLGADSAIKVRLPGPEHKCASFVPILLTNKTDFACNAVKSRIACAETSYDQTSDRTRIVFASKKSGNVEKTSIEFGRAELERFSGRLDRLITHPQFTLIPAAIDGALLVEKVSKISAAQEKSCVERGVRTSAECRRLARFQADSTMQEFIRRYRNPRSDSSKEAIAKDSIKLVDYLRSKGIDRLKEKWILFLSVAANEVGLEVADSSVVAHDPIYGVSDAVLGNSGLSFGAHQIDLGANGDDELQLFWKVIEAYKTRHPDALLDNADIAKDCIDLPLRLMTVAALSLTYQVAPRMTVALRSDEGFEEYNRRLLAYLANEVNITGSKQGLFQRSMIVRTLFSDLRNQVGSGKKIQDMANEAQRAGLNLDSCEEIEAAENEILSKLIWVDPKDLSKGKTQYAVRYENIGRIVRKRADRGGITTCN